MRFASGRAFFLALLAAGLYTAREFGPRPGSVASALGIQRQVSWQVMSRSIRRARANHAHGNPQKVVLVFVLRYAAISGVPQQPSRPGSHGTTAALQAFPFVTATNGVSACVCMSVRAWACLSVRACHPKILHQAGTRNSIKNRGAIHLFLLFFHFDILLAAACCCCSCVPVSHRKRLTLWEPWYNSSRTSRSSLCDSYERCFCVCECTYYVTLSS